MFVCTVKTFNYKHINIIITMVTTLFYYIAAVSTFYTFYVIILYRRDLYIVLGIATYIDVPEGGN
jgi:hypothetical protein